MSQDVQPAREPWTENAGLSTEEIWKLALLLHRRVAFRTEDGLLGRSVLDYPPGFEFGDPGLESGELGAGWFQKSQPSFVVWSQAGVGGAVHTVAWWSERQGRWCMPTLPQEVPDAVREHQWLVRVLSLPIPGARGVVG